MSAISVVRIRWLLGLSVVTLLGALLLVPALVLLRAFGELESSDVAATGIAVRQLDGSRVRGSTVLEDVLGSEGLSLCVQAPRPIHGQATMTILYSGGALLV